MTDNLGEILDLLLDGKLIEKTDMKDFMDKDLSFYSQKGLEKIEKLKNRPEKSFKEKAHVVAVIVNAK